MSENRTLSATPRGQTHHVCVATTTVAFALSRGMTIAQIEAMTDIDAAALGDPAARLPDDVPHRLWNALAAAEPDIALGIEAARSAHFSALGGLVHGAQYAATLREALDFVVRNSSLLADRLEITVREDAEEVAITASHPNDAIDAGRVAEVGIALIVRLVREILGIRHPPQRVELPYSPNGPIDAYHDFFRSELLFDAGHTALVFPSAVMSMSVRTADPTLFVFVERHFELLLSQIARSEEAADLSRLRRAIAEAAAAGDFRAATVAARARVSLRSARRTAATHGLTLRKMIDEARRLNAETFLADRTVPIATVASLVGFSDERSFRRAFKRWTGEAPSVFSKRRTNRS
ncbi:MAG: AraC family transcriptional regulator ligand-binding domain-containing protein [Pseudomonadota bacterium]